MFCYFKIMFISQWYMSYQLLWLQVCEEARCPNIGECWGGGEYATSTATIMVSVLSLRDAHTHTRTISQCYGPD